MSSIDGARIINVRSGVSIATSSWRRPAGKQQTSPAATHAVSPFYRTATALLATVLLAAAACGGAGSDGVWSIERGMTIEQVRDALGRPWKRITDSNGPEPGGRGLWWLYPARKENTSIAWIYFRFNDQRRVETIFYGYSFGTIHAE